MVPRESGSLSNIRPRSRGNPAAFVPPLFNPPRDQQLHHPQVSTYLIVINLTYIPKPNYYPATGGDKPSRYVTLGELCLAAVKRKQKCQSRHGGRPD